jgi:hypothetical protein
MLAKGISEPGLDGLYSEVLRQVFNAEDDTVMSRFKLLMGRILATKSLILCQPIQSYEMMIAAVRAFVERC